MQVSSYDLVRLGRVARSRHCFIQWSPGGDCEGPPPFSLRQFLGQSPSHKTQVSNRAAHRQKQLTLVGSSTIMNT